MSPTTQQEEKPTRVSWLAILQVIYPSIQSEPNSLSPRFHHDLLEHFEDGFAYTEDEAYEEDSAEY